MGAPGGGDCPTYCGTSPTRSRQYRWGIELKKRFGLRIPILTADKEELSGYPLEIAALERYLARELDERVFGHVRV